jgi:ligand-binding SRPBCC domain-containing protein
VKGVLPRYVHEHILSAEADGQVLVVDRIEFEPPGGLLGFMLTADRLRSSLQSGLVHRHNALKRLLEET